MTDNKAQSLGFFLAFGAAFLFSTKPILIKWLYALGITSMPLMGIRMLLAMPVYLIVGFVIWQRMSQKPDKVTVIKAAGVGLFGYYLASFLDLWGLEMVSAQLERIVLYSYPTFVVVLSVLFFGFRLRSKTLVALLLSYLGIGFMFGHDLQTASIQGNQQGVIFGRVLILGSALSFALFVLFSKNYIEKLGSLFFTCVSMTSASLATLIHYLLVEGVSFPTMNAKLWVGTLVLVIFVTVVPTFMFSAAIKYLGPEKAGISGTLGPLMTTAMAIVLIGEPFGWMTAAGMALVIFGVSLLRK